MDSNDFETELSFIFETGKINGFSSMVLKKMYEKHKRKQEIDRLTTLLPLNDKNLKYISMPFYPPITYKLDNELKKFGYRIAYKNNGKLSDLLGTAKDKVKEESEKSGIYKINCSMCDALYIGQTKRKLSTRFKEHCDDCLKPPNQEKPMPQHSIENSHPFGEVKLLKEVRKPFQLDAYESIYLYKNKSKKLVNVQKEGNCPSTLYQFLESN